MSNSIDWLPSIMALSDFDGNWDAYLKALYEVFKKDFIADRPQFQGTKLALKRHPVVEGKEATFWHIISEGKQEEDRLPDLRRCERIGWIRPIIENKNESEIKIWENQRNGETRICLWCEGAEFLVILAHRKDYILLWTAYPVTQSHQKKKLQREYEAYKKG